MRLLVTRASAIMSARTGGAVLVLNYKIAVIPIPEDSKLLRNIYY